MAVKISVCVGSSCGGKGGTSLVRDIEEICQGRAIVDPGQCLGKCANGPNVEVVSGGSTSITTKVKNYKKAIEIVQDAVEDIEISKIMRSVGKVKWESRREESGANRQTKIAEAIKLVGGEEAGSKKQPLIMSELFVLRCKELLKERKFPEALEDAEKALKLQAEWPQALIARAAALENIGRNGDAVADLEHALKLNRGIGAEKSSIVRIKMRVERKVQEHGPVGPSAAGAAPAAPAAAKPAEGDGATPEAKAKAKPKAKKKAAPKDAALAADGAAAPVEKKAGTKKKEDSGTKDAAKDAKTDKKTTKTTTKTKTDANKDDAEPKKPVAEAKEAPAPADDPGDMPFQEWRLDEVKPISHDCITMLYSCGTKMKLARYPRVGDVWHVDLIAEVGEEEIVRAYTPVSSQDDYFRGKLELMIKVYPEGKMTQHLSKMDPTDKNNPAKLLVSAPLSTVDPKDYAEGMALVAGGTAVTLALQVCSAVLKLSADAALAPPVHAFLCNRTDEDALYQDRFSQLQATYPSFRVVNCLSQGALPENKPGRAEWYKGRVDSTILATAEMHLKAVVSGPPGMCQTALKLLTKMGRSRDSVEVVDDVPEDEEVAEAEDPIAASCTIETNAGGENVSTPIPLRGPPEPEVPVELIETNAGGENVFTLIPLPGPPEPLVPGELVTQPGRAAAADLAPKSFFSSLFCACRPARKRSPSRDCEEGAIVIADE